MFLWVPPRALASCLTETEAGEVQRPAGFDQCLQVEITPVLVEPKFH